MGIVQNKRYKDISQLNSRLPHAVGFGCYTYSGAILVAKAANKDITNEIIDDCIETGIKLKFIIDNDYPIKKKDRDAWEEKYKEKCPAWWRCFCRSPIHYMQLVARALGMNFSTPPTEFYRGPDRKPYAEMTDTMIEWETNFGSHFTLPDYDPYIGLARTGKIKSVRFWRLKFWNNAYEPT